MEKILLVDDIEDIHKLFRTVLGKNYLVVSAYSATEALRLIDADPFIDLVILDVNMPEVDGFELCKIIKSGPHKDIPVIFNTGNVEDEDIVKGLRAGANDYITKPIDLDVLRVRIETQLRIRRLQKELLEAERLSGINSMVVTYNHQINNPLSAAVTALHSLIELYPEIKDSESIDTLKLSHQRIQEITEKIANIADPKTTTYAGDLQMLDVKLNNNH